MTIEKATVNDHSLLTEITKKSKAYWNYSEDLLLAWDEALTITQDYLNVYPVYKLVIEEKTVGYYSYFEEKNQTIKLDNLFLLPQYIGKGIGSYLMTDFLNRIQKQNFQRIYLDAEPYAEGFYKKHGFKTIGSFETAIKGRFMPVMELRISNI